MPWYKITIANDVYVDLNIDLLLEALEAAWAVDQAPDAALYHARSASESLFFVSPSLAQIANETLNKFHAVPCYPPTIAHLLQVIPGPKDKAPPIIGDR